MRILFKYSIIWVFLLASVQSISAQHITVSAPSSIVAGENFRLSYTINTQNVEDFRAGTMPSAIEVIAGPYTSRQSSYQMVNGHTSSSSSITYTYTLYIAKAGVYTIAPASAQIGGRKVYSKSIKLSVSGQAKGGNGNGTSGNSKFACHLWIHHILAPCNTAIRTPIYTLYMEAFLLRQFYFLCVKACQIRHISF